MTTLVWILGILLLFMIVKIAFNPRPNIRRYTQQTGGGRSIANQYWDGEQS